jgi:hypothetical protein
MKGRVLYLEVKFVYPVMVSDSQKQSFLTLPAR